MGTVHNYDNVVKVAETFLKDVKNEIAGVTNMMKRRVDSGDYYMVDLIDNLTLLQSSLHYLEAVSRHFERGLISQLSPLSALDALPLEDNMLRGLALYSGVIMVELKNSESITV